MDWVEETYSLLERQRDPDFPLALGNYIDSYVNALEILDHGYCSDKRRDAQKNFRPIYDITGIPAAIIDDFYAAVVNWVNDVYPSLDYVDLATTILPKYLVSCPYHSADKGGTKYYQELDLDRILSHINVHDQSLVYKKLERWLSDIVVLDMPYDPEKGLSYYDL
jgi:CRISPR-associated endonuclease/helicase Cas3